MYKFQIIYVFIILLVKYSQCQDDTIDIARKNQLDTELTWSSILTADFTTGQYDNYTFDSNQWEKTPTGLKLNSESGHITSIPYTGNETIFLKVNVLYRAGTNSSITFGGLPSGSETFDNGLILTNSGPGSQRPSLTLFLLPGDRIHIVMTRDLKVSEPTYIDSIYVSPKSDNSSNWKPSWTQDKPQVAPFTTKSKGLSDVAIVGIVVGVAAFLCGTVFGTLKYRR